MIRGRRSGKGPPREQEELQLPSKMVKMPESWSSRPVRDPRECCGGDQSSPQLQRCKSTRSVVMSRTGAGVERASQAGDAQMPTWDDQRLRRVFPSLELTTATCGAEHQRRQVRHRMRLQVRIRRME